jgi:hypothetical protein
MDSVVSRLGGTFNVGGGMGATVQDVFLHWGWKLVRIIHAWDDAEFTLDVMLNSRFCMMGLSMLLGEDGVSCG